MGIGRHKCLPTVYGFLTVAQVARASKWVKDIMRYKTGKWKNHELLVLFLNFSAYIAHSQTYEISGEEMDTLV